MSSEKTDLSSPVDPLVSVPSPVSIQGEIVACFRVPEFDRHKLDDTPKAYAIEIADDVPGGCIIWGMHHDEWLPNVSPRWIVRALWESGDELFDEAVMYRGRLRVEGEMDNGQLDIAIENGKRFFWSH